MEELLRAQWHAAVTTGHDGAHPGPSWTSVDDAFARLLARHREPHRHYHTVAHLCDAITTAEELLAHVDVADPAAVRLSLFFHDAVYNPRSATNEAASAGVAREVLTELGQPQRRIDAVAAIVEATADHEVPVGVEADAAAVVIDADLSILAAEPARYSAYVAGVRSEYAHVDDSGWRRGRAEVLRRLLDRPSIFLTAVMRPRESRARANLAAELSDLAPRPPAASDG